MIRPFGMREEEEEEQEQEPDIEGETLQELMDAMQGMDNERLPKGSGVSITISSGGGGDGMDDLSGIDPRLEEILRKKRAAR